MEVSRYINIFKGHTDRVRWLVVWKDYLWSSSKDETIKQWNASGHCINTLEGHTGYVICLLGWKDFLYSVEDGGTIRVWNLEGECVREIQGSKLTSYHGLSIWRDSLVHCSANTVQMFN